MFALDCETTGLDGPHGARPYFVTICREDGNQQHWRWEVDIKTREVCPDLDELAEVVSRIEDSEEPIIGQNIRFDVKMLTRLCEDFGIPLHWPWERTHDTLLAAHLLASNQQKDLTSLAVHYLGLDIQPYEDRLEEAVQTCRRRVQQSRLKLKRQTTKVSTFKVNQGSLFQEASYHDWAIAEAGRGDMPSAKEKTWKFDTWLPYAYAEAEGYTIPEVDCQHLWLTDDLCSKCKGHRYYLVLEEYANTDSVVTVALWSGQGQWHGMEQELKDRDLWDIYVLLRRDSLPIFTEMEQWGFTLHKRRLDEQRRQYEESSKRATEACLTLSEGKLDKLPVNGVSTALRNVVFGDFGLKSTKVTANGNDCLDKYQIEEWLSVLDPKDKPYLFLRNLQRYRKRKTALGFIDAYERFWLDVDPLLRRPTDNEADALMRQDYEEEQGDERYYVLYPSINPTATDTLRCGCNNPNLMQISKQEIAEEGEEGKGHTARYMFGPIPGREWYSLDYENIELRIPAYESGEQEMIALFENPSAPPYFGSQHLLYFHLLHPDKFTEAVCPKCLGRGCFAAVGNGKPALQPCQPRKPLCEIKGGVKTKYGADWYQWTKNGDFAIQYGCQERKADSTYHVEGAYRKIKKRFVKQEALNQKWIAFADRHGFVETLPDKTINPRRGYPLLCSRTEWGKISPTIPLSYHVQGTAMWCTLKAMLRCQAQLREWNVELPKYQQYRMALQVHDEIVFDFPSRGNPKQEASKQTEAGSSNLGRIRRMRELMEQSGQDIGVPLKVAITWNPNNWSEGIAL